LAEPIRRPKPSLSDQRYNTLVTSTYRSGKSSAAPSCTHGRKGDRVNMPERILRGAGKLRKQGKYLCNTQFEITVQESRGPGRPNLIGYLIGFDPKPLLGLAGETG
jgi:hypothetical protein